MLYVAQRSASIFTDQVLKASIRLANAIAREPDAVMGEHAGKLPKFETFYASASHAACECRKLPEVASQCTPSTADIFCQPYMRCLEQKGIFATGAYVSDTGQPIFLVVTSSDVRIEGDF